MVDTWKTGKTEKKVKKSNLQLEFENDFFHESAPEQDKRDARKISSPAEKAKLWHVKGIRVFFRHKMGCSGANFHTI